MSITNVTQKISSLNLASNIRWIAMLPMKQLFPDIQTKNIAMNLQSYEIPEQSVSTAEVAYKGYSIEIPTYVRSQTKNVTFEYLMSSDFHQYKMLYNWFSRCVSEPGNAAGSAEGMSSYSLPVKVLMLSEFKKPILEIQYENCWIKNFGPIRLDYKDTEGAVIQHSFTLSYSFFSIVDPTSP